MAQIRLEAQPHRRGLLLHGAAQLRGVHGRDQLLMGLHQVLQRRVGGAVAPEVRAHRQHHVEARLALPGGDQRLDEPRPALGVGAQGEELLELIDHQQGVAPAGQRRGERPGQRALGVCARGEGADLFWRGAIPVLFPRTETRHQPGQHQGGLAAARGAEHGEEALGAQARGEGCDQGLAAEEEGLLLALEGLEPREGTTPVPGRDRLVQGERREAQVQRLLGEGIESVQGLLTLRPCRRAQGTGVGREARAQDPGLFVEGRPQHWRTLGEERTQALEPEADLRRGERPIRLQAVAEEWAPGEALEERRDPDVAATLQGRTRLHQGQVRLAALAQAGIEGGGERPRGLDADPLGHGDHGGDAELAHQALGEPAERRLGLGLGPLTGGEEDQMGQAAVGAHPAQAADQVRPGDRCDRARGVEQIHHRLPVRPNRPVGEQMQQGVAARGDALGEGVEAGGTQGTGDGAEPVVGDLAEGGGNRLGGGSGLDGGEPVGVVGGRVGEHHQGAQVAPPDGGEAPVGEARQVARVGGGLIEREEVPAAHPVGGAQALPAQGAQLRVFDHQQDAQPPGAGAGAGGDEGVADRALERAPRRAGCRTRAVGRAARSARRRSPRGPHTPAAAPAAPRSGAQAHPGG